MYKYIIYIYIYHGLNRLTESAIEMQHELDYITKFEALSLPLSNLKNPMHCCLPRKIAATQAASPKLSCHHSAAVGPTKKLQCLPRG